MKLSISILSLLCLLSAPTLSLSKKIQHLISTTGLNVPGDSPLQYCEADQSSDILTLEYFNVDPNPPQPYAQPFQPAQTCDRSADLPLLVGKTAPSTQPGFSAKKLMWAPMSSCRLSSTSTSLFSRPRSICANK